MTIAAILTLALLASPARAEPPALATASFAGGCFWCMEKPFDLLPGVASTTVGYTGGHKPDPTYGEVSSGSTGHAEAVEVVYDPKRISYQKLLEVFWHNIDPTSRDRQFCDRGSQYRSAIFYHDVGQQRSAEASKTQLEESGKIKQAIVTQIVAAATFYRAEDYHQDYYRNHPLRYAYYRQACRRDQRLKEIWTSPKLARDEKTQK